MIDLIVLGLFLVGWGLFIGVKGGEGMKGYEPKKGWEVVEKILSLKTGETITLWSHHGDITIKRIEPTECLLKDTGVKG